jgi:hypothetical protein
MDEVLPAQTDLDLLLVLVGETGGLWWLPC